MATQTPQFLPVYFRYGLCAVYPSDKVYFVCVIACGTDPGDKLSDGTPFTPKFIGVIGFGRRTVMEDAFKSSMGKAIHHKIITGGYSNISPTFEDLCCVGAGIIDMTQHCSKPIVTSSPSNEEASSYALASVLSDRLGTKLKTGYHAGGWALGNGISQVSASVLSSFGNIFPTLGLCMNRLKGSTVHKPSSLETHMDMSKIITKATNVQKVYDVKMGTTYEGSLLKAAYPAWTQVTKEKSAPPKTLKDNPRKRRRVIE